MGEKAFNSIHGTLTKKAIGMLMLLAYNLMDDNGHRLMKEYDPILVDICSSTPIDDIQEVKLCNGQMKSMVVNFSNVDDGDVYAETSRQRATGYCYLAASYLRLFAKTTYNYQKVGINVIKAIKKQFEVDCQFRNTLYVILSSGCAEPEGQNLKKFLYNIHLNYTDLHTYVLFVRAMQNLHVTCAQLGNTIYTPMFEPQLDAISKLLDLEHSHEPEYSRHMWKFGRLFDRNFMSVLQIKNCVTFGLVLAYIVSETSGPNREGPLKIAGLREASSGNKDEALCIALRTIYLCRSERLGVEHAEAAKARLIGRKRVHMG